MVEYDFIFLEKKDECIFFLCSSHLFSLFDVAVCKDPPYKVEESGYAGFILPIEVYFKNKRKYMSKCQELKQKGEEPKKVRFDYDLFLHLEGHPPVNHLRCEKLTFNNPTEEFRRKLLKAGGIKDKSHVKMGKVKIESEASEKKKSTLPPFDDIVDPNDSDVEENMSSKSDSEQPSPASSSSSSSSSFTPSQTRQQGPLRSIMKDLHSDDNEEESDEAEDNDNDSEMERPVNRGGSRSRRVSLSDGSDSESSSASSPLHHEPPPPLLKTNNNQILEVKSPIKQSKSDKQIKNGECDKAYLDELVELHRRLMTLRERHILQQIVNLIEETGHFHITNTTFDFDLCSLDKTTVRKLQSYLETSGTS
ncbi:Protein AF-9 [Pteropus alecto]|uniref:Protein AF-9 n=1 Tax=Pteropus alecto TaxID=9402 RepID=L5K5L5_PTEAL|nr:Protein AF-9 [Pteropus alecto]